MKWARSHDLDATDFVVLLGLLLIPLGVAYWSPPAAAIVFGIELVGLGLLFGLTRPPRPPS